MSEYSPYRKLKRDMNPHVNNYKTLDAGISLPKKWFKDCIDMEMRKALTDLDERITRLERRLAEHSKGEDKS